MLKRLAVIVVLLLLVAAGVAAFVGYYWTHRFDSAIAAVARRYELDPALVKAVIYEESFFDPDARSSQNAVGLMQVTPIVAREWVDATRSSSMAEAVAGIARPGDKQPLDKRTLEEQLRDPWVSLHVGCWYLQTLLERYAADRDPLVVALAAYNAGPSNVDRWAPNPNRSRMSRDEFIARIDFPVTRSYVQKIIRRYDDYKGSARLN